MKNVFGRVLAAGAVLTFAHSAFAAAAVDDLICKGGGYTVNISYVIAITDNAQVKMKIEKDSKTLVDVSTEGDEGKSVDFIHNGYTTKTDVDANGNILRYGSGVAPSKLLAYLGSGSSRPQLLKIDLEKNVLSINGVKLAQLSCQSK